MPSLVGSEMCIRDSPHDGIVSELSESLHIGRYIRASDRLMRIVSERAQTLTALPDDIEATRLSDDASFTFISDDAAARPIRGRLTALAPTSEAVITDTLLTSIAGGKIAVNPDEKEQLLAHRPVFKVQGKAHGSLHLSRAQRGIVKLKPNHKARRKLYGARLFAYSTEKLTFSLQAIFDITVQPA